ncbi:hypothetical protein HYW99_02490 [Candidatus Woesearchaeota archaeon]|nr:hypothetical protein [Candidatus Woesearchaeota archaeon]
MRKTLTALILSAELTLGINNFTYGSRLEEVSQTMPAEDTVTAGNLYFYKADNFLTYDELQFMLNSMEINFNKIGIKFKNVKVIDKEQFQELNGLDILIYILNEEKGVSTFGVRDWQGIVNDYTRLKLKIRFPYDELVSYTNTGFVNLGDLKYDCLANMAIPTKEQFFRVIIQMLTHEVAHGLGASHVFYTKKNPRPDVLSTVLGFPNDYFMGFRNCIRDQSFYEGNIVQMKDFIKETISSKYSKQEIINKRIEYHRKRHYVSY